MQNAIERMCNAICDILHDNVLCMYLFGSVTMDDFQPGWSDIDFLCLTEHPITDTQAQLLLPLRQTLLKNEPGNPYYRSFEGIITSLEEFRSEQFSKVVYWGTSGQRIRSSYKFDVFSQYSLLRHGRLIRGTDVREQFTMPSYAELVRGVEKHYQSIRQYTVTTGPELYSCGWLLDIARCLYTLKTGDLISKTEAGRWALAHNLCPEPEQMRKTLEIRLSPEQYREDWDVQVWLSSLGPTVQRFADVLEQDITAYSSQGDCHASFRTGSQ